MAVRVQRVAWQWRLYPRAESDDLQDALAQEEAAEHRVQEDDHRHVENPAGARVRRLELRRSEHEHATIGKCDGQRSTVHAVLEMQQQLREAI